MNNESDSNGIASHLNNSQSLNYSSYNWTHSYDYENSTGGNDNYYDSANYNQVMSEWQEQIDAEKDAWEETWTYDPD